MKRIKGPILIVLVSLVAEGCPQLALQLARYWQQQGFSIELLCLCDQPTDLQSEFEKLKISINFFRLGSGLPRYPRLAWLSYQMCRRLRPSAILSFPLGWHAFIAIGARLAGVPNVCAHVGNLPPVWTGNAFRKFKLLVQLGRPFTQRLLCCSEYIRLATVRDFGVSSHETRTIHNACDLERFSAGQYFSVQHDPPRLAMVARLERHKDHNTLIRAVALLRDQSFDVELWLVGEGSCRSALEDLIDDLQLSDRVQLLGCRRNIPALLAQVDLFVFSARPDEGFGIALAEAMATGVPIVASDVGACREVLDAGRCGLLVEPGSVAAFAAGICQVLSEPMIAMKQSHAAKARAQNLFSIEKMALAYNQELGLLPKT